MMMSCARAARSTAGFRITPVGIAWRGRPQNFRQYHQLLASSAHSKIPSSHPASSISIHSRTLFTKRKPRPIRKAFVYTLLAFTATFGVAYHLDSRSAIHRWIAIPILQTVLDAETAQKLAVKLLSLAIMPRDMVADDEILAAEVSLNSAYSNAGLPLSLCTDLVSSCKFAGLQLSNPIGLAAGFDKQAEAIDGLLNLGFGLVEIGSVTPLPQPGNEKPRYFRLIPDRAAINRYGFNSEGHNVILGRLRERIQKWVLSSSHLARSRIAVPDYDSETAHLLREADINTVLASDHVPKSLRHGQLLGVNLGKNKNSPEESVDDYIKGVERLGPYADFVVINVSSPNTPGLRGMQKKKILTELMAQVVKARERLANKVPILVKISPDLQEKELHDIADAAIDSGIQGLIVSNTTTSRPSSLLSKKELTDEKGGLSGHPLKPLALQAIQTVRERVGDKMSIIGCGGIFSGEDALDFAKAGADVIELYTSFGYEGVGHPRRIKDELVTLLKAQGKTWKQVVGTGLEEKDYIGKLPTNEKEHVKVGGLDERFGLAVASVKSDLEDLRRSAGVAKNALASNTKTEEEMRNRLLDTSSPTARPVFRPDPSDAEYTSLLDRVHDVLGKRSDAIEKQESMKTEMTQAEALRVKLGIALQDPEIPPSVALEVVGQQATVGGAVAIDGKLEPSLRQLQYVEARGTATKADRRSQGRIGMGGRADFNATDRARVV